MSTSIIEPLIAAPPSAFLLADGAAAPSSSSGEVGINVQPEKRSEVRYSTCDAVEVSLLDMAGLKVHGVVREVSRNGLGIELLSPISVGARMKISLHKGANVFAVARDCRQTRDTYQVGVEIESVYFPNHISMSSLQLDSVDSRLEPRELARLIVQHHTSYAWGNRDQLPCRLSPVSNGPM